MVLQQNSDVTLSGRATIKKVIVLFFCSSFVTFLQSDRQK